MNTSLRWKIAQYFELRWWKNYLLEKDRDTYLVWKKNYWYGIIQQVETIIGKQIILEDVNLQILDAGCGPAGVNIVLENHQVTAIDPLLDEYEKQVGHFSLADYPWVNFTNKPLEALADQEKYEVVFCMNVINHVADMELCLQNLSASLHKGGYLAMTVDAHNYSFFKHLFRLVPGDILHPHQYDLPEYIDLTEATGLSLVGQQRIKKDGLFDHYLLVFSKTDELA